MFKKYGELFKIPGSAAFSSTGLIARMPISMITISLVLLVSQTTGSYGIAGIVSAVATFSTAVAMPQIAKYVDRKGQARIARPVILFAVVIWVLAIIAVSSGWPHWTWIVIALIGGGAAPSIGAMVRARWMHVLPDKSLQQRAFSWESSLDEIVFMTGPPLATILATSVAPYAGLLAALILLLFGGFLFTAQRSSEPPPQVTEHRVSTLALLKGSILVVGAVFICGGIGFGSIEVIVVAFADEQGHKSLAGLVLAAYAFGSLLAGLTFGVMKWKRSVGGQFVAAAVLFGVLAQGLLLASNLWMLTVLIFIAGVAIAPVLISATMLIERLVPPYALTEGLTWATTALVAGVTIGAAVGGQLIDSYGARTAFLLPTCAALVAAIIAVVASPRLRFSAVQKTSQRMHASAIDSPAPGGTPAERVDENVE
ncbi:putative MFS family arabinose efflux permease [Antricoccus suffuscus]|uniref:Putative MFS family arabinose efflux permease n=1 Tax=Antricoccus suffuscus TaxID=1629062 RepID=A0A2T0ZZ96_9ACTN|nr:MFS transporter [Antricoccus suffuscus]PRZ41675.1 putative MFS family arabinose efflux permease [Antricoccus suffuscus]